MAFKGIIMILIGLTGISVTIMWFSKSIRGGDINNKGSDINMENEGVYTLGEKESNEGMISHNEVSHLEFDSQIEGFKSTVFLDEYEEGEEVDETVLLDEDIY